MPMAAPALPPPLRAGDRLTREEFLRRWDSMPELKRAELIFGVVQMASPVSRIHSNCHSHLSYWLNSFAAYTPGVEMGIASTWLMLDESAPQPDLDLRITPAAGGQSREEGAYAAGAPELIVEVSHTTAGKDSAAKQRLYKSAGVQEYLTVRPERKQLTWRRLQARLVQGKCAELAADKQGVYRSRVFPGLWLDPAALWLGDLPGLAKTVQAGVASLDHARFLQALARRRGES